MSGRGSVGIFRVGELPHCFLLRRQPGNRDGDPISVRRPKFHQPARVRPRRGGQIGRGSRGLICPGLVSRKEGASSIGLTNVARRKHMLPPAHLLWLIKTRSAWWRDIRSTHSALGRSLPSALASAPARPAPHSLAFSAVHPCPGTTVGPPAPISMWCGRR